MSVLFDVERRELPRLLPLTIAYGLVMASLYVLKPVRNALFLDEQGIGQLPYVLLLVALVGGGAALVFTRLAARWRLDRLILATFLFLGLCLLGFRLLLPLGWGWTYYLFYVWVNLYGLMATSLLWLQANTTFNARQGRRVFGLIGTSGILGAILGGGMTSWVVDVTGTENLLLVCAAMVGACLLLLVPLRSRETAETGDVGSAQAQAGAVATVRASQLLSLLATMGGLAAVVAAIIDVQFNSIVDQAFDDLDGKTAFFGQFFAWLSGFALLFQVLVTPRVMRSTGVTSALLFLPASMALGSVAVLFVPGLLAGVLLKIGDGGLRHSIHKSATEILYLPVPAQDKKKTKVLLDTTVDNVATGLGALIVLVALSAGVDYQNLAWISMALVALWFLFIGRSRRAYIDTFRQALERRDIDLAQYTLDASEAGTLNSLLETLTPDGMARRLLYALQMLIGVRDARVTAKVLPLLAHADGEVRASALRVLQQQREELPVEYVEALLADPMLNVRAQALFALCVHDTAHRSQRLAAALADDRRPLRSAAVACIAEHGSDEELEIVDEFFVDRLLNDAATDEQELIQVARLLGKLAPVDQRTYLRTALMRLLASDWPRVVRQAIDSIGRLADEPLLGQVMDRLDERRYYRAAAQALAGYGDVALSPLFDRILDGNTDSRSRQRAARALAQIETQATVQGIFANMAKVEPSVQYQLLKSLSKLRNRQVGLSFDEHVVRAWLTRTVAAVITWRRIRQSLGSGHHALLCRALEEKVAQHLKRIFRLLGLLYPPKDLYSAYLGYARGEGGTHASALELLENLLSRQDREQVLPILEPSASDAVVGMSIDESCQHLLAGDDPWLRALAIHALLRTPDQAQQLRLAQLRQDPDSLVRETAQSVLSAH